MAGKWRLMGIRCGGGCPMVIIGQVEWFMVARTPHETCERVEGTLVSKMRI